MSTRDPDLDAIKEEDIFDEARDRLRISIDADSSNRSLAKEDLLFREGLNHWDNDFVTTESMASPELVINFTDTLVNRVVNNIADLDTRGKCHPIADGADTEVADLITGIGRHIEYRSDAQVAYDIATDAAVTFGWGWARLIAEYASPKSFDKELRIVPVMNTFSVYPDPGAMMPTACDMNWALITLKMQRTEFKRLYPKIPLLAWNEAGRGDANDWEDKEEIRLAEYMRIREKDEMLYQLEGPKGVAACYERDLPKNLKARGISIVDQRESTRRECQWFRLNGMKVVERMTLPWTMIPLVRCQGNARDIDGKVYRRGMVRTLQDPQRMVDYGEVAKVKRLGLTTQSKWVAAEGQLDGHPEWIDANLAPIPVLIYKPVTVMTSQGEVPLPPPQPIPPAQIEAGFSEFVEGMRSNLLAIAGMPNEPGQDQGAGQTVSGRAIQRRDKLSDQSHSQYYKNKKLFVAQIWRLILEGIPHYYSGQRQQRIIGGDGKPQMTTINQEVTGDDGEITIQNDVSIGEYEVVMDAGPSYETRREEGAENLLELMSNPAVAELVTKTAPDLLFRSMDFDYAEEIADRLAAQTPEGLQKIMDNLSKEAKAVVQSLSQQNAQLKQALQQAQLENKYGIAKAHLAATVKAHDVEESNKTKRADTESKERTTIAVHHLDNEAKLRDTEIKVSGELLNTHVEAKYHEREAERLIEQGESAEKDK
jgi:Phage P22-like portal protein